MLIDAVRNGQKVRHQTWTDDELVPLVGVVVLPPDPEPGVGRGAVVWEGYRDSAGRPIGDALEKVAHRLEPA